MVQDQHRQTANAANQKSFTRLYLVVQIPAIEKKDNILVLALTNML